MATSYKPSVLFRKALDRSLAVTACALAACATPPPEPASAPATAPASKPAPPPRPKAEIGAWGVDVSGIDKAVAAGDDFERYANGGWLDRFTIPADLSTYGVFVQLGLDAEGDVRTILQDLSQEEHEAGSIEQKVGDAFAAWMNTEAIEARGLAPLKPHLDKIAKLRGRTAIADAFATLHNTSPYGMGIIPNPADTTQYIVFAAQDGLGLPDRDYYLKDEPRFEQYRAAYLKYIETMLGLAGIKRPKSKAKRIMSLETKLAKAHWTQAESRDIKKIYNPMSPAALAKLAPEFNWPAALKKMGLDAVKTIVVAQPTAIQASGKIVRKTRLGTLRDYLTFHFIRNHATVLPKAFDDGHFDFYRKTLRGIEVQRERWKRGVNLINDGMGEAVGKIYIKRHFPPAAKQQMDELVANLIAAFRERLQQNDWMDEQTRQQALTKLSTFEPRIGYPDKWIDYEPLTVSDDAFANARAIREFQWQDQVKRLAGPVDRKLWPYPPQTVNASYNPLLNQITFPAGILQPPFFDPKADPAVNYGAIGAVIGHEIGHGFDDQGRRFDEMGKIRDWWTEASDEAFNQRTEMLGAQYASYEPIEGMNINPKLTMGENIGDLGGVQMAHAAYRRYLSSCCNGEAPVINGVTGDQRFFLGWAQVWRAKYREDEARQRLTTDPHSPPRYRIIGVVRNVDAWYDAFGVTAENKLFLPPGERVRIW